MASSKTNTILYIPPYHLYVPMTPQVGVPSLIFTQQETTQRVVRIKLVLLGEAHVTDR